LLRGKKSDRHCLETFFLRKKVWEFFGGQASFPGAKRSGILIEEEKNLHMAKIQQKWPETADIKISAELIDR
jgi:hypothetical protein